MNIEVFRRLMEQATIVTNDSDNTQRFSLAEFAELIVRECADRATWAQDTNAKDIGGEVLKHFGVEE